MVTKKQPKTISADQSGQQTIKRIAAGSIQLEPPKGWLRWLGYFISCWPIIGLVLAIIYYPQAEPGTKKFGQQVLIISLISLTILIVNLFLKLIIELIQGSAQGLTGGYY